MSDEHIVQPGEYLSAIAAEHKITDYKFISERAENAEFKRRNPDPNLLIPGSRLYIPDREFKEETGATERRHTFRRKRTVIKLRVRLRDDNDNPLAGIDYTLTFGDVVLKATTDGQGLLEKEIPVGTAAAELKLVKSGAAWLLKIGHLTPVYDPVDNQPVIAGMQARLNNLGFRCGEVNGELNQLTRKAMIGFQRAVLERGSPDGNPDEETRNELINQHGC
jgi:N-acetylmuramoyl-L-alanine amidase